MVQNLLNSTRTKINDLDEQISSMVEYMQLKIQAEDWHAVADAAMDIREIESEMKALKDMVGNLELLKIAEDMKNEKTVYPDTSHILNNK